MCFAFGFTASHWIPHRAQPFRRATRKLRCTKPPETQRPRCSSMHGGSCVYRGKPNAISFWEGITGITPRYGMILTPKGLKGLSDLTLFSLKDKTGCDIWLNLPFILLIVHVLLFPYYCMFPFFGEGSECINININIYIYVCIQYINPKNSIQSCHFSQF